MLLKSLLKDKRREIIEIAAKHGAFNVRIFGSVATGKERDNSDIDFLIDYDPEKVTSWFPGGLLMDLQDLLGCKVDIVTEDGINHLIRDHVLREAKPL